MDAEPNAGQSAELPTPNAIGRRTRTRGQREIEVDKASSEVGALRLSGAGFREIARTVNCSVATAHARWKRFRNSTVRGSVDEERQVMVLRLEKQYLQLATKRNNADIGAHRVSKEILELMVAVQGLAAPITQEMRFPDGTPHSVTVIDRLEFALQPIPDQSDPWRNATPVAQLEAGSDPPSDDKVSGNGGSHRDR